MTTINIATANGVTTRTVELQGCDIGSAVSEVGYVLEDFPNAKSDTFTTDPPEIFVTCEPNQVVPISTMLNQIGKKVHKPNYDDFDRFGDIG